MLAIDGGDKVRVDPMPARALFGEHEKQAAVELFDQAIAAGGAFGYNGPEHKAYEQEFAEFLGGGFAHSVNSGTTALYVALRALELEPGDEVICPPITDAGGVMPVPLQLLVPVIADGWPGSYNMGPAEIEAAVTERTRAVVLAHIGGDPCDMDPVLALAQKHGLAVVEDCAQSHGALYKGRLVGAIGTISAFSTMSGKHHASGAQGGMVFTSDEDLYWKAVRYGDRGKPYNTDAGSNVAASLNMNQNDLGATIGRVQLRKLPGMAARRMQAGEAVRRGLESGAVATRVGPIVPDTQSTYWFMRFQLDMEKLTVSKERFVEALGAEGIGCSPSYRHIPSEAKWFREQNVFGTSGYPWQLPCYKGPRNPSYDLPHIVATCESSFNVGINENYGEREAADIVAAVAKVEEAYLK